MRAGARFTIRTRLTLWYAAVFVVTGAILLTTVYLLARRELFSANVALTETIQGLTPAIPPSEGDAAPGHVGSPTAAPTGSTRVPAVAASPELAEAIDASRQATLQVILIQSGIVFAIMTVIALLLCWLVASRALRPLRAITTLAERLSHDTLQERIAHDGPHDELRTLAETFNTMLDRLARTFQAQRLFAANASHELRTPLTIIQTAAEQALSRPNRPEADYRRALNIVVAAAHRSERLLSGLLTLARLRQQPGHQQTVDLAASAAGAAAALPGPGPELRAELAPATLTADPVLIELLLRNLLDNAARYNVDGGSIWLRTEMRGDTAILAVVNTGPVLSDDDVGRMLQAFQRGAGRTGTDGYGLGLAIVDAIVDAHHGHWTAAPRPGGGLSVEICLPASWTVLDAHAPPASRGAVASLAD
ncbi:HAMP domain-containing sensor histidine kinase [Polymorphospora sp. NPDC051019]|uniref:sensor histidine kinase n=1 Tax=Polymorphospora sp. NPDC051019 TaxID=3155725 RepID=UPI003412C8F4